PRGSPPPCGLRANTATRRLNARVHRAALVDRWSKNKSHWRKTFLISLGSETTLDCTRQLTGRLPTARGPMPRPEEGIWEIEHFAKRPSPGERVEAQCLGEMPWISRATAIRPDGSYVERT